MSGFDWDEHNRGKCQKHGVSLAEIESLFADPLMVRPDIAHADAEVRFQAIGRTAGGRHVFLVFTLRAAGGREPAPYMHAKEVAHYEKENPGH